MIAPNDKQPGRNDPCPCGSGQKYKHCCLNPQVQAMRQDHIRMKVLAHLFLTQIQKLTGAPAVAVTDETLRTYPPRHEIKMVRDRAKGVFLFAAEPPEQPLIEAPRRIVLPN